MIGIIKFFSTPNIPEFDGGAFSVLAGLIYLTIAKEIKNLKAHLVEMGLALFAPAVPLLIIGFMSEEYISATVGVLAAIFGFIFVWQGEKRKSP